MLYDRPLREARDAVIPAVPLLAPGLKERPSVITEALFAALDSQGVDPERIPAGDTNRLERHTIAGYLGNRLRHEMVDGAGPESTFRDFNPGWSPLNRGLTFDRNRRFRQEVRDMHDRAVDKVQHYYTEGHDAEHRWWSLAEERYGILGELAKKINPGYVPPEGESLDTGLRSTTLEGTVLAMLTRFRQQTPTMSAEVRVQALHDNISFIAMPSTLNLTHFQQLRTTATIENLDFDVAWDATHNRYNLRLTVASRGLIRAVTRRPLVLATLKCPMHTPMIISEETGLRADYHSGRRRGTNLLTMLHALVNAAGKHGFYFGERNA